MNKKEALEILGFSDSANPQEWELEERYKEKMIFTLSQDKSVEENFEQYKELRIAYSFLFKQFNGPASKLFDYVNLDNDINSLSDLESVLSSAISRKDVKLLKKVFSKFKSSKNG